MESKTPKTISTDDSWTDLAKAVDDADQVRRRVATDRPPRRNFQADEAAASKLIGGALDKMSPTDVAAVLRLLTEAKRKDNESSAKGVFVHSDTSTADVVDPEPYKQILAIRREELKTTKGPFVSGRRRKRGGKRVARKRGKGGSIPRVPPTLEVVMAVPFRMRYYVGSTLTANTLTRGSFFGMFGGVMSTTTNMVCIASSFRFKRIVSWPPLNGDVQVSFVLSGTAEQALVKESVKVDDLPDGITVTGAQVFAPKKGTYAAMWQNTSNPSDAILNISATKGSIMDFECVFTLRAGDTPYNIGLSVASTTGYHVYYSPIGGNLQPQGVDHPVH